MKTATLWPSLQVCRNRVGYLLHLVNTITQVEVFPTCGKYLLYLLLRVFNRKMRHNTQNRFLTNKSPQVLPFFQDFSPEKNGRFGLPQFIRENCGGVIIITQLVILIPLYTPICTGTGIQPRTCTEDLRVPVVAAAAEMLQHLYPGQE